MTFSSSVGSRHSTRTCRASCATHWELEAAFPGGAVRANPMCLPERAPAFDTCSPQTVCAPDAACGPTGEGARLSPGRSVRYHHPGVSGTGVLTRPGLPRPAWPHAWRLPHPVSGRDAHAAFLAAADAHVAWFRVDGRYADEVAAVAAVDRAYAVTRGAFAVIEVEGVGPAREGRVLLDGLAALHRDGGARPDWKAFKAAREDFVAAARAALQELRDGQSQPRIVTDGGADAR